MHACKLKCNKINPNNDLSADSYFEKGVAKTQQGVVHENQMTVAERNACKTLLKSCESMSDDETLSYNEDVEEDMTRAIANQEKRKAQEFEGQSKHINCDFMMGSTTIVEQLRSKGGCVHASRRLCMSPMFFEMIVFLKENADRWKINDVVVANERRKDINKDTRENKNMTIITQLSSSKN